MLAPRILPVEPAAPFSGSKVMGLKLKATCYFSGSFGLVRIRDFPLDHVSHKLKESLR